jgi:TRAP-type C4-dicarboxylate transport system substrate-binding protein
MLTRKQFITGALGLAGAAAAGDAVRAQDTAIELKVSHYLPPNHTFQKELVAWGDALEKASAGRLKLRVYPASQLGPVNRQFDMARNGTADITVVLHGATPGRFPITELVSLPYMSPSAGSTSAIASRRLTELSGQYLVAEHPGVQILWMAVTNPLMFHSSKVAIRHPDDFKGLRVRYAGEGFAQIITALGATPLAVPPGETQDGLAKGIIDAATFPYEACQSFDLGTVVKYSLEPGISSATFAVVMNQRKFDNLPTDLRALISKSTGIECAAEFGKAFDVAEKAGREYMLGKGVQIITLSPNDLQAIKTKVEPMIAASLDNVEKTGKPGKAFLAAYRA